MKYNLNKLNVMNYYFSSTTENYYLTCGLRSLFNISKQYNVSFKDLCINLLTDNHATYEKNFYIVMI